MGVLSHGNEGKEAGGSPPEVGMRDDSGRVARGKGGGEYGVIVGAQPGSAGFRELPRA